MVRLLHWLIRFYQIAISPLLGPRCRYIPSIWLLYPFVIVS